MILLDPAIVEGAGGKQRDDERRPQSDCRAEYAAVQLEQEQLVDNGDADR
jgi:hypothetical protein